MFEEGSFEEISNNKERQDWGEEKEDRYEREEHKIGNIVRMGVICSPSQKS